jgi:hypothetical protein
LRSF